MITFIDAREEALRALRAFMNAQTEPLSQDEVFSVLYDIAYRIVPTGIDTLLMWGRNHPHLRETGHRFERVFSGASEDRIHERAVESIYEDLVHFYDKQYRGNRNVRFVVTPTSIMLHSIEVPDYVLY